jgi:hypothetical protein
MIRLRPEESRVAELHPVAGPSADLALHNSLPRQGDVQRRRNLRAVRSGESSSRMCRSPFVLLTARIRRAALEIEQGLFDDLVADL